MATPSRAGDCQSLEIYQSHMSVNKWTVVPEMYTNRWFIDQCSWTFHLMYYMTFVVDVKIWQMCQCFQRAFRYLITVFTQHNAICRMFDFPFTCPVAFESWPSFLPWSKCKFKACWKPLQIMKEIKKKMYKKRKSIHNRMHHSKGP